MNLVQILESLAGSYDRVVGAKGKGAEIIDRFKGMGIERFGAIAKALEEATTAKAAAPTPAAAAPIPIPRVSALDRYESLLAEGKSRAAGQLYSEKADEICQEQGERQRAAAAERRRSENVRR